MFKITFNKLINLVLSYKSLYNFFYKILNNLISDRDMFID